MDVWHLRFYLNLVNLGASFLFLVHLLINRVFITYGYLSIYLLISLSVELYRLPGATHQAYYVTHAIKIPLAILLVMELYELGLGGHTALATFGKRALAYFIFAAIVFAVLTLFMNPNREMGGFLPSFTFNYYFLWIASAVDSALFMFLLLICLFLAWFPVRVRRNVSYLIAGFTVYFAVEWLQGLAIVAWPQYLPQVDVIESFISITCFLVGILLIRRKGELITIVTGYRGDSVSIGRLTAQLETLNARLVRFVE